MDNTKANPAVNEELWRAWVEQGRQREKAADRKARLFAGAALVFLSLGLGFYLLTVG